ncbi:MAG: hypothetical protein AUJ48_04640 [Deltaproteobacteria bacterium CG1_02_45_11]|nr:MAG: hypothetical protein AUJ48_04640 [Deltaproteobacteria bacterium CG1_02_45_11]HCW75681.1 hypothetical protein [Candidatus Neomarinimicrobiota bacterium]
MEKILVAIDTNMTSLWSLVYALNLAKRMQIRISILLFSNSSVSVHAQQEKTNSKFSIKTEIEKLIAEGRSDGIYIDYYHTCGSYKDEIIKFIQEKKINLLVIEKHITDKNLSEFIEEIKLRTSGRIELVQPKDIQP